MAVDANSATYPVRIALLNATNEVKSGMAANVTFHFGNGSKEEVKELKQYIDGENEIEFDLVNFLDNLEQNEVEDFFDLLVLMIDQELSVTEKNNLFFSDN